MCMYVYTYVCVYILRAYACVPVITQVNKTKGASHRLNYLSIKRGGN